MGEPMETDDVDGGPPGSPPGTISSSGSELKLEEMNPLVHYQRPSKAVFKHPNPELSVRIIEAEWVNIKRNLSCAVAKMDFDTGYIGWLERFSTYMDNYRFFFVKNDHILMLKMLSEVAVDLDLEPYICLRTLIVLERLLRKCDELLEPGDLQVKWRDWYNLAYKYSSLSYDNNRRILVQETGIFTKIKSVCMKIQLFFPQNATEEILEEIRKHEVPLGPSNNCYGDFLAFLLPCAVTPASADNPPFKKWFEKRIADWDYYINDESIEDFQTLTLLGRVSRQTGTVDWEPHLPKIFNRVLRNFCLPLNIPSSVGIKVVRRTNGEELKKIPVTQTLASLVVGVLGGGSGLNHLRTLFRTLENYYHPSNNGPWTNSLNIFLCDLISFFLIRVHSERFKRPNWSTTLVPESAKLTDEEISEFVDIVSDSAFMALYARHKFSLLYTRVTENPAIWIQKLAQLDPEPVLEKLLEKTYQALSTLTEVHQLQSVLSTVTCCVAVAFTEQRRYPSGRLKILQLLPELLPALDLNDHEKLYSSLALIQYVVYHTPLVDCSRAGQVNSDLTETELELCHWTANLEFFLHELVGRFISIIECLKSVGVSQERPNSAGGTGGTQLDMLITDLFSSVLYNCSKELAWIVVKRILEYACSTIQEEGSPAASLTCGMVAACVSQKSEMTLQYMMPKIHSKLVDLGCGYNLSSDRDVDKEFYWCCKLFKTVRHADKGQLCEHQDKIIQCADILLKANHKSIYRVGCDFLNDAINALVSTVSLRHKRPSFDSPLNEYVPAKDIGRLPEYESLDYEWDRPSDGDVRLAELLTETFLFPQMRRLENLVAGASEESITPDELLKILWIIRSCGEGTIPALQGVEEPHEGITSQFCDLAPFTYPVELIETRFKYSATLRRQLGHLMHQLVNFMLTCQDRENDTKSITNIISVIKTMMMCMYRPLDLNGLVSYYSSRRISYFGTKCRLNKKTCGYMANVETFLHYFASMTRGRIPGPLGAWAKMLLMDLWRLAISRYPTVRSSAQHALFGIFEKYKYSCRLLIDSIVSILNQQSPEDHALKGALYTVSIHKGVQTMMGIRDLGLQKKLWLAVLKCRSQKKSISKLIHDILAKLSRSFPSVGIVYKGSERTRKAANNVLDTLDESLTSSDLQEVDKLVEELNNTRMKQLMAISDDLMAVAEDPSTRVVVLQICHFLIRHCCIRRDVSPTPPRVVKLFLDATVNDALIIRKIGYDQLLKCFYLNKRRAVSEQKTLPELRDACASKDSGLKSWFLYSSSKDRTSCYDSNYFIDRSHLAYNADETSAIFVYAPAKFQWSFNPSEMTEFEKTVFDWLSNRDNFSKFVSYLSADEKVTGTNIDMNSHEKQHKNRIKLWQFIFRILQDEAIKLLGEYVPSILEQKTDHSHRFFAELVSGALHATKLWPLCKIENLRKFLLPILEMKLMDQNAETSELWLTSMQAMVKDFDPMRLQWFFQWILDKVNQMDPDHFSQNHLQLLATGSVADSKSFESHELRRKLYDVALKLKHSRFSAYRGECATLIVNSVAFDVFEPWARMNDHEMTWAAFFDSQHELLQPILAPDFVVDEDPDKNPLLRHADTVCRVVRCVWRTEFSYMFQTFPQIYKVLPVLAHLEGLQKDEECAKAAVDALQVCALLHLSPCCFPEVISSLEQMCGASGWRVRRLCLVFIQQLSLNNMYMIRSSPDLSKHIVHIVTKLLKDEQFEVRELAGSTFSGLLCCNISRVDTTVLKKFIRLANKEIPSSKSETNLDQNMVTRHAGVLGLGACIRAYPYEVPEWMPGVLMNLQGHIHDPNPIEGSVRKTFLDFKRTHHDNWNEHKKRFSEDELTTLSEILVAPSYYV